MSSEFGKNIKIQVFGQSHSSAIGAVIDGIPAGLKINDKKINDFMQRRAPGKNKISTKRSEDDISEILSGVVDGYTVGAPICITIKNTDIRSDDYAQFADIPRPGHSDYSAFIKYGKFHDIRGGGHFSGRLTAPLCFAGALCKQILENRGIFIGAHILSIADEKDEMFDAVNINASKLLQISEKPFPVLNDKSGKNMLAKIQAAENDGDSVGGVIECVIVGMPAGAGEPMFDGIENKISSAIFAIPGVKGIEFGAGFSCTYMCGSENNDEFYFENQTVKTKTNNHGGVLGGISTGMPILFRVAVKPTPSIAKEQNSVNLSKGENAKLKVTGRHDPCIVPRAVACVEAVAAIVLADVLS